MGLVCHVGNGRQEPVDAGCEASKVAALLEDALVALHKVGHRPGPRLDDGQAAAGRAGAFPDGVAAWARLSRRANSTRCIAALSYAVVRPAIRERLEGILGPVANQRANPTPHRSGCMARSRREAAGMSQDGGTGWPRREVLKAGATLAGAALAQPHLGYVASGRELRMAHRLKWLGHSAWQLVTSGGKVVLIDPWLSRNPLAAVKIEELPRADYVLLTHDHFDHAGDVVAVVRQTGATLVAQVETAARYRREGVPENKVLFGRGMNIGGSVNLGGITVTMTDAYHSSETGTPTGYILTLEDGKVLYHAGDTALHSNMATWGQLFDIDVALLPIGNVFTMDGRQAAHALRLLRAKMALPMHYRTFPILAQDASDFVRHAREQAPGAQVRVIEVGEEVSF